MKNLRPILLFLFILTMLSTASVAVWQNVSAQTKPLTYPEIITALATKLPNRSFKNKTELVNWLVVQIKKRKVDKPLTPDREDDLRQAGATTPLIEVIRENSPKSSMTVSTATPKPTPIAKTQPVPVPTPPVSINEVKNSVGMEFIEILPGTFLMGSDKYEDEKPTHRVTFNYAFFIGKYEITIGEWKAVMGDLPEGMKKDLDAKFKENNRQPVVKVSWDEVKQFIAKLNTKNDGYTYRLPSESEWEFAARAATASEFAFGNSLSSTQANFDGRNPFGNAEANVYLEKTVIVGSYKPNSWGLYDMHGNVWEWTEDAYSGTYNFRALPVNGAPYLGLKKDSLRVLRGGSWNNYGLALRSAGRYGVEPTFRSNDTGFRIVAIPVRKKR
jgi:formylglycine-generating enzyme required for sulfatase activity